MRGKCVKWTAPDTVLFKNDPSNIFFCKTNKTDGKMARITSSIVTDEKTWQTQFYETVFGNDIESVHVDRSTDGYTTGIIFEHKQNVTSYGKNKALSQALIYLTRFNRDGIPVPSKICLVSQDEQKCFIYDSQDYLTVIEDIEQYANLKASDGIAGFRAGACKKEIQFNMASARGMTEIINFISEAPKTIKVHVTVNNVYGWSCFYYDNAEEYKQKPEKKAFFNELRNPQKTLKDFIYPWEGEEKDFKFIMDMLNDPKTQRELGAFYTPPEYAKLATKLVYQAIERAKKSGKKDFIILDRCAGSGNLEMFFDDETLSHVIVSTYELKEWIVLKDRFGSRVRYIIPPIPTSKDVFPKLNEEGFLSGANALTKDIIDNREVRKYIDNKDCAVILFENPPYIEPNGNTGTSGEWKNNFVITEMKNDNSISGTATNEMGNAFIWSGFKYFLREPYDSYIVFSPAKYWKSQHIVNKKFGYGYAFNRVKFHAKTQATVMCAWWINEDDNKTKTISLRAINLDSENKPIDEGEIEVRKVFNNISERFYDKRDFKNDSDDGIAINLDGTERIDASVRVRTKYNKNIIGYLVANSFTFDNNRLNAGLTVTGRYDGNGCFIRKDNYLKLLPLFAAARYSDHESDWKVMSLIMKCADKAEKYEKDYESGILNEFVHKVLFWICMSHYPHMRSLNGSDKRLYKNELCFDGNTLAKKEWMDFVKSGYKESEEEIVLFEKMKELLKMIRRCAEEYNKDFSYGLFQIDEEINVKIETGQKSDGTPKFDYKYGDLNNLIKEIESLSREYYRNNLEDILFQYEFLK